MLPSLIVIASFYGSAAAFPIHGVNIATFYGSGALVPIPAVKRESTTTCGQTEPKLGFGSQAGRRTSVLASRIGAQREGAQTSVLVPRPGKGQDIGLGLPDR